MFKKIFIVYSEKITAKHQKTIEEVKNIVKDFSIKRADLIEKKDFDNIELVITIGGDGAFIRAASFLKETPIIGINSEPETSEGALLCLQENELEKLKKIIYGDYNIKKRERIEVFINNKKIDCLALNDVYFGSENQFHTSRYKIHFEGKEEEQRSSGVLISTASGSTAWYKSAGGTPFQENLRFVVREPFIGRIFNSKILNGELKEAEGIEFENKRHRGGVIALDSSHIYPLKFGDKIKIKKSNCQLNCII